MGCIENSTAAAAECGSGGRDEEPPAQLGGLAPCCCTRIAEPERARRSCSDALPSPRTPQADEKLILFDEFLSWWKYEHATDSGKRKHRGHHYSARFKLNIVSAAMVFIFSALRCASTVLIARFDRRRNCTLPSTSAGSLLRPPVRPPGGMPYLHSRFSNSMLAPPGPIGMCVE